MRLPGSHPRDTDADLLAGQSALLPSRDPRSIQLIAGADGRVRVGAAAGRASYTLARRLAASLLDTGITVILDSPCFYQEQLDAGQRVAADHGADYRYVECVTEDLDVIAARLRAGTAYPTQCRDMDQVPATAGKTAAAGSAGWQEWIDGMKRLADRSVYLPPHRHQPSRQRVRSRHPPLPPDRHRRATVATAWYIRHGHNAPNQSRQLSHKIIDYSLSERGVTQATALAGQLAARPSSPAHTDA